MLSQETGLENGERKMEQTRKGGSGNQLSFPSLSIRSDQLVCLSTGPQFPHL